MQSTDLINDPARETDYPLASDFSADELKRRLAGSPATDAGHAAFLSYMSHELRTPLTAIIGFSQAMRLSASHPELSVDSNEYAELIEVSSQQLLKVVTIILSYLDEACTIETGGLRNPDV